MGAADRKGYHLWCWMSVMGAFSRVGGWLTGMGIVGLCGGRGLCFGVGFLVPRFLPRSFLVWGGGSSRPGPGRGPCVVGDAGADGAIKRRTAADPRARAASLLAAGRAGWARRSLSESPAWAGRRGN